MTSRTTNSASNAYVSSTLDSSAVSRHSADDQKVETKATYSKVKSEAGSRTDFQKPLSARKVQAVHGVSIKQRIASALGFAPPPSVQHMDSKAIGVHVRNLIMSHSERRTQDQWRELVSDLGGRDMPLETLKGFVAGLLPWKNSALWPTPPYEEEQSRFAVDALITGPGDAAMPPELVGVIVLAHVDSFDNSGLTLKDNASVIRRMVERFSALGQAHRKCLFAFAREHGHRAPVVGEKALSLMLASAHSDMEPLRACLQELAQQPNWGAHLTAHIKMLQTAASSICRDGLLDGYVEVFRSLSHRPASEWGGVNQKSRVLSSMIRFFPEVPFSEVPIGKLVQQKMITVLLAERLRSHAADDPAGKLGWLAQPAMVLDATEWLTLLRTASPAGEKAPWWSSLVVMPWTQAGGLSSDGAQLLAHLKIASLDRPSVDLARATSKQLADVLDAAAELTPQEMGQAVLGTLDGYADAMVSDAKNARPAEKTYNDLVYGAVAQSLEQASSSGIDAERPSLAQLGAISHLLERANLVRRGEASPEALLGQALADLETLEAHLSDDEFIALATGVIAAHRVTKDSRLFIGKGAQVLELETPAGATPSRADALFIRASAVALGRWDIVKLPAGIDNPAFIEVAQITPTRNTSPIKNGAPDHDWPLASLAKLEDPAIRTEMTLRAAYNSSMAAKLTPEGFSHLHQAVLARFREGLEPDAGGVLTLDSKSSQLPASTAQVMKINEATLLAFYEHADVAFGVQELRRSPPGPAQKLDKARETSLRHALSVYKNCINEVAQALNSTRPQLAKGLMSRLGSSRDNLQEALKITGDAERVRESKTAMLARMDALAEADDAGLAKALEASARSPETAPLGELHTTIHLAPSSKPEASS